MRSDYDPVEARSAILRESLSVLCHMLLYPFGFLRSRHRAVGRRELRTLVFVHGWAANRATFFPLQVYLHFGGHRRQFAFNHRSAGSIEALAVGLRREIDANIKGGRIDLVAHSMGGLVARCYLQQLGGARRVDRLITIGTPHQGTYAAHYVPSALVRQLKPGSPFLIRLNALQPPERVRVLSLGGDEDLLVLPRESARCPFGESRMLANVGHLGLLLSPAVFAAVRSELLAGQVAGPPILVHNCGA